MKGSRVSCSFSTLKLRHSQAHVKKMYNTDILCLRPYNRLTLSLGFCWIMTSSMNDNVMIVIVLCSFLRASNLFKICNVMATISDNSRFAIFRYIAIFRLLSVFYHSNIYLAFASIEI